MFQSLTGRLKTRSESETRATRPIQFQSLTGRLKTSVPYWRISRFANSFQSLTGRLKTSLLFPLVLAQMLRFNPSQVG